MAACFRSQEYEGSAFDSAGGYVGVQTFGLACANELGIRCEVGHFVHPFNRGYCGGMCSMGHGIGGWPSTTSVTRSAHATARALASIQAP